MNRFPMKMMMAVVALLAPLPALAQAIRADLLPLPRSSGDFRCESGPIRFDPALCRFFVTVINAGLLEAGPFLVSVSYDTGLNYSLTVGGLVPGATARVSFPGAFGCADLDFGFFIQVDGFDDVPESNEQNNTTSDRCDRD